MSEPDMAEEPILDVVRGLSTITSIMIVVNQVKNIYTAFFTGVCERCRGTGIMTCPHCHGTKTLRQRPGLLRTRDFGVVANPRDAYLCFYCGPPSQYDFDPFQSDDEDRAVEVQANMKSAMSNSFPRPFDCPPLAGTVTCPTCKGSPRVSRITPDFGRALGLDERWDLQILRRTGRWYWGRESRPADKKRLFLEYPSAAPPSFEAEGPVVKGTDAEWDDTQAALAAGGPKAFENLEHYVITYASDDEDL